MIEKRPLLLLPILAALGCASTPRRPTAPGRPITGRRWPAIRPCRADALVLDLPLAVHPEPLTSSSADFEARVASLRADFAARMTPSWFEGSGHEVSPVIRSVLPEKSYAARREDGHQRFLRVTFEDANGEPFPLLPLGQCQAVATLRQLRAAHGFGDYYVARECELSAQSSWPLQSLGATDQTAANLSETAVARSRLVLLDTPVAEPVAERLNIEDLGAELVPRSPPQAKLRHLHGSGMAILARRLTAARMWSVAVLDEKGVGTPAILARGLDAVLERLDDPATPDLPTVINTSLGWPNQLEDKALLRVPPTCETVEDPVGEPVRYLLDLIRDRDADVPTAVIAAAGNQSLPTPTRTFEAPPLGVGTPAPSPLKVIPEVDYWRGGTYPGTYLRDLTEHAGRPVSLALGVGALDARGRVARTEARTAPTVLYGPGQHVVTDWDTRLGEAPPQPVCVPRPPHVEAEFPRSFTGSSVASVLAAATAAEVQAIRRSGGKPAFSFGALTRLLVQTGRRCANGKVGFQGTELSFEAATGVVASMNQPDGPCASLEECLESTSFAPAGGSVVDPASSACAEVRAACLEAVVPPSALVCDLDRGRPRFPESDCAPTALPPLPVERCSTADPCPRPHGKEVALLGPVGPQPSDGSCSWCAMQIASGGDEMLVILDLFPPNTDGLPASGSLRFSGYDVACASKIDARVPLGTVSGGLFTLTLDSEDLAACPGDVEPRLSPLSLTADLIIEGTRKGVPYAEVNPLHIEEQ